MSEIITHGGFRIGAGRKKLEPTKVIRVPESRIMEIKDYLNKPKNEAEISNIRQIDPVTYLEIPLAVERVQAGFPSPAQDYIDQKVDLNEHLIKNANATFIVKVDSLSMLNIGIDINDELIVDRSLEAKHRDVIIACIDNELTVKRLMLEGDNHWLKAENPNFPDIHFNEGQIIEIWGVVTRVIKSFR
ncbi:MULTISPECIES: LexA family transcriptional regulator [unclassified Acinetobacter]|uniref:LexA family protein n=1 Tax=unclassified Acinetobacter TaxID=196816 RepID=UPI0015D2D778|nr:MULTISPECIES: translesion error-prone DNA polymerase V autoproteolytic subunit [unclassified Acinetobacter]UUS61845.1 translesion error-prone DNA polymerase V autoproteolytic subunit [Acinetobacter sp. YH16056_T]